MTRKTFYFHLQPTAQDFDELQHNIADSIRIAHSAIGVGVVNGMEVSVVANNLKVSQGIAYDVLGQPITLQTEASLNLNAITINSEDEIIYILAQYAQIGVDARTDAKGDSYFGRYIDSVTLTMEMHPSNYNHKNFAVQNKIIIGSYSIQQSMDWSTLISGTNLINRREAIIIRDKNTLLLSKAQEVHVNLFKSNGNIDESMILEVEKRFSYKNNNLIGSIFQQLPVCLAPSNRLGDYGIWYEISHVKEMASNFFRVVGGEAKSWGTGVQRCGVPNIKTNTTTSSTGEYGIISNVMNLQKKGAFNPISRSYYGLAITKYTSICIEYGDIDASLSSHVYQNGLSEVRPQNQSMRLYMLVGYIWDSKTKTYFEQKAGALQMVDIYSYLNITALY